MDISFLGANCADLQVNKACISLTQAIRHLRTHSRNNHKPLFSGVGGTVTLFLLACLCRSATGDPCRVKAQYSKRSKHFHLSFSRDKITQWLSNRNLEKSRRVTFCSAEDFLHKPVQRHRKDRFAEMFMGEIQIAYSEACSAFRHCLEHPR